MHQAVVVGAGPAGLTAARVLRQRGADVVVLERSSEAGGLPRFAGHLGWGMADFKRVWTGPTYAGRLRAAARGVEVITNMAVTALHPGGLISVSGPEGAATIAGRVVLLATGIRETPRSTRLVSGTRPWGVTTTGAFQELVYGGGILPFRRPIIIGTELVAFSAVLTARHGGIKPVAMIEAGVRIAARRPADLIARWLLGVPVLTATRLIEICGGAAVDSVVVERAGRRTTIPCDGVIFSGAFTPEASLVRLGHLDYDIATGGPSIDNFWRCSDPSYFAAGNVIRPVEHSGFAAREGQLAAEAMLRALHNALPAPQEAIPLTTAGALRYAYPQRLFAQQGTVTLYARACTAHRGYLRLLADGQTVVQRAGHILPERRLTLSLPAKRLHGVRALVATLD